MGLVAPLRVLSLASRHGLHWGASCRRRCAEAAAAASSSSTRYEEGLPQGACGGVVKPDITFFGESLGNRVTASLQADRRRADLLLVMGTSLQVAPMSHVCKLLARDRPQVLINKQSVRLRPELSDGFDVELLGNADDVVAALAAELTWPLTGADAGDAGAPSSGASLGHPQCPRPAPGYPRVHLFPGAVWAPPAEVLPATPSGSNAADGVMCDVCREHIKGPFFTCDACLWFDVCDACYKRDRTPTGPRKARKPHPAASNAPWAAAHAGHSFTAMVANFGTAS